MTRAAQVGVNVVDEPTDPIPSAPPTYLPYPADPASPTYPVADLQSPPPARRRWPLVTTIAVVVAAAIAVPAAVVTSNHHATKSPLAVLTAASGRTTASRTAHLSSVETISEGGRSAGAIHLDGDTDFAHQASALTMTSQGTTIEQMRSIAGVEYVASPLATLPNGAHWVKIRPADLGLPAGTSPGESNDPSSGLQYLSAVNGNPRVIGSATVDGVDTTHYSFTIDLKSITDKLSKSTSKLGVPGFGAALGQLGALLDLGKVPGQAWIDHQGRVRRFVLSISISELGQSITSVETMNFTDFDAPVSISPPAASDTVPFSSVPSFFSQLGGAAAGPGISS